MPWWRYSRSLSVRGINIVKREMRRYGRKANRAFAGGLYQEAERIMARSKQEVPVDTGLLRSTGHVQLPKEEAGTVVVVLGYGGPARDYAVEQHENLEYRHRVGKAKYLSEPAEAAMFGMTDRIAQHIRREMGDG